MDVACHMGDKMCQISSRMFSACSICYYRDKGRGRVGDFLEIPHRYLPRQTEVVVAVMSRGTLQGALRHPIARKPLASVQLFGVPSMRVPD